MKTPIELAAEHARAYVNNRGWRVAPLTVDEVALLLEYVRLPDRGGWWPGWGEWRREPARGPVIASPVGKEAS